MCAQHSFDAQAFCWAIEQRDVLSQISFYATDAEIRLTSLGQSSSTPQTVLSGANIRDWIREKCTENLTYQVVHHWVDNDHMMVTEECCRSDGTTSLSASTARVAGGYITSQSVVIIQQH